MAGLIRWLATLSAPLLLSSCLIVPAKFVSTLDVRADRSFTFTYVGEVQLLKSKSDQSPDMDEAPTDDGGSDQSWDGQEDDDPRMIQIAAQTTMQGPTKADESFGDSDEESAKLQQLVTTLSNEYGYRSVRYIGHRKLAIDYRISGKLDHAFVFPFNPDGEIMFPFLAIELRGKDKVRVKAPGFANDQSPSRSMGGMGGGEAPGSLLDGSFTLTTNAEIVSQNQENGAQSLPDGAKKIVWAANPNTRDAPMAVLRVSALP